MGKVYDGIHRTTFVLNETGEITNIIAKPMVKEHGIELLEK